MARLSWQRYRAELARLEAALPYFLGKAPPLGTKEEPFPEKLPSLAEMLPRVLEKNPDILLARAKVQAAEAELGLVRLKVAQDFSQAYLGVEASRAGLDEAKYRFQVCKELHKKSAISTEELEEARLTVARFQAELTALEADVLYFLGKTSVPTPDKERR